MVTARELVVLSGSFTSHSMSLRRLCHLRGHASHERYTVSNAEDTRSKSPQVSPARRGLNLGPPRDMRARYHLHYILLPSSTQNEEARTNPPRMSVFDRRGEATMLAFLESSAGVVQRCVYFSRPKTLLINRITF